MIFVIAYLILDSIVKNECMKKFTLLFALLKAMGVSAKAQQISKWPVTPRVGVNISNVVRGKAPGIRCSVSPFGSRRSPGSCYNR